MSLLSLRAQGPFILFSTKAFEILVVLIFLTISSSLFLNRASCMGFTSSMRACLGVSVWLVLAGPLDDRGGPAAGPGPAA